MITTLKQIALDIGARLGLLGPHVLHANVRRAMWKEVLQANRDLPMADSEIAHKATLINWMKSKGKTFPVRFVGYRTEKGRQPVFNDMTIHGFEIGPQWVDPTSLMGEQMARGDYEPHKEVVNLVWSSSMFDNGAVQRMFWCLPNNKVPVL